MIILRKKIFSQEPIDISHLSEGAQKKIIARERKKIELDQKISDTEEKLELNKRRASMSISDNAKLGAYELQKNPLASAGSSIGGAVLGSKIAQGAGAVLGGGGDGLYMASRMIGSTLAPAITKATGSVVGAVKGLTAGMTAKRKEKKLMRLAKKRAKLGE